MSKKVTPYNLYLSLRPRAQESRKAYEALTNILEKHSNSRAELAGIGHDSHHVIFCLRFTVPVSNTDPASIASIKCINEIFDSMFEYMPCYAPEPTATEASAAMRLVTAQERANMLDNGIEEPLFDTPHTTPVLVK